MLEKDKMATALAQNTHINAYIQTKPPAMMEVEMQTYSKQKIDEFPSTQPHDIYILDSLSICVTWAQTWNFIGSTTDNTTWGCKWKNKTLQLDKTISLMCFSSFNQAGFFSMRVMQRFNVGTFIMVLVSSCWENKLKVTRLLKVMTVSKIVINCVNNRKHKYIYIFLKIITKKKLLNVKIESEYFFFHFLHYSFYAPFLKKLRKGHVYYCREEGVRVHVMSRLPLGHDVTLIYPLLLTML